jgi:multisubunit Na+/H+ antiporter MnhF subunit
LSLVLLSVLLAAFCALTAMFAQAPFLMDVAISWVLLGFVGTLALVKTIEGKALDE